MTEGGGIKIKKKMTQKKKTPFNEAIYAEDLKKNLYKVALAFLLIGFLFALYYLLSSIFSPRPKVYVQLYQPKTRSYKHTSVKEMNEYLHIHSVMKLKVKIIAGKDPYENAYGEQTYRDFADIKFLNPADRVMGKGFIKMWLANPRMVQGEGTVEIYRRADQDNSIQEYVTVQLTNEARTADKLPVKVKFE